MDFMRSGTPYRHPGCEPERTYWVHHMTLEYFAYEQLIAEATWRSAIGHQGDRMTARGVLFLGDWR